MVSHVWQDYIVMENGEIKKKIFCGPTCPTGGARWTAMWGMLGCTFCSEKKKLTKKKFFLIEKVAVEIRNDYAKHPYQHSMYFTLYPLLR